MVYNRTGYAPWSLTREAGVQSATVDGTIEVPQYIQPVLDTGFVDEKGNWKGVKSTDETFFIDAPHLNTPNGTAVLAPQTADRDFINMTGFEDLFIAIFTTQTGNYRIQAVMGPDTKGFANLTPLNAAADLRGNLAGPNPNTLKDQFLVAAEPLVGDVWNIYSIKTALKNQKNMQIKITNNSGSTAGITFAYMRVV